MWCAANNLSWHFFSCHSHPPPPPPSLSSSIYHTEHHASPIAFSLTPNTEVLYVFFNCGCHIALHVSLCGIPPSLLPSVLLFPSPCVLLHPYFRHSPSTLSPPLPWTSIEHHCHAVLWCIHSFGRKHTLLFVVLHAHKHHMFIPAISFFLSLHTELSSSSSLLSC